MAELSIGDAVGAGFQLIRRRPFEVLAWGLAGLVTAAATFGVFGSFYAGVLGELVRSGGAINPMASPEVLASFQRMQGSSVLLVCLARSSTASSTARCFVRSFILSKGGSPTSGLARPKCLP